MGISISSQHLAINSNNQKVVSFQKNEALFKVSVSETLATKGISPCISFVASPSHAAFAGLMHIHPTASPEVINSRTDQMFSQFPPVPASVSSKLEVYMRGGAFGDARSKRAADAAKSRIMRYVSPENLTFYDETGSKYEPDKGTGLSIDPKTKVVHRDVS